MADIKLHNTPQFLSHIRTIDNQEYVLILWKTRGFEREKHYTLHLCDLTAGLISEEPYLEFYLPFEQRHRYAPYFRNFMPLLVYAIAMGMYPKRIRTVYRLSMRDLDRIYGKFLEDYNNTKFDSLVIAAPEIGKVIKGRIQSDE